MGQLVQNAALRCRPGAGAALPQADQRAFQRLQFAQPRAHMAQVRVQQGVHRAAIGLRLVVHRQQAADFVQAHVQRPAMANQAQPLDVAIGVIAEIPRRARWRRQQGLFFVIADGVHRAPGQPGEFANLHRGS